MLCKADGYKSEEKMNNINRHNYEEYFLLYVDNELTEQQRAEVECFITENPDLAPELNILQDVKLKPEEETVFDLKLNLYKNSEKESMLHNYEYWFLLYVDNELTPAQRKEVEKMVLQNPEIQPAFSALKQSVLEPEVISFPDKPTLYRKEKVKWMPAVTRLAAAAVFISVLLFSWWYAGKEDAQLTAIVTPAPKNIPLQQPQVKKETELQLPDKVATLDNKPAEILPTPAAEKISQPKKDHFKPAIAQQHETKKRFADEEFLIAENKPTFLKSENAGVPEPKVTDKTNPSTQAFADNEEENNGKPAYKIITAGYKEINTSEEDQSLYIAGLNLNKNKVKGLFKKAENFLNNKSREYIKGDGKLQVANLEFEDNK